MLIHANPSTPHASVIEGDAHIVISLDEKGAASMRAYFNGRFDSKYCVLPDERLLGREVPKLLAELREQLQGASESMVTS